MEDQPLEVSDPAGGLLTAALTAVPDRASTQAAGTCISFKAVAGP